MQIDVDVICDINDGDLKEYLPCKGDRVAAIALAKKKKRTDGEEDRKSVIVDSLRSRMGVSGASLNYKNDSDSDNKLDFDKKKKNKSYFATFQQKPKRNMENQAEHASKHDRQLLVGLSMYDDRNNRYRQVRSPMGGGPRFPRVGKRTEKKKLLEMLPPLYFKKVNCIGHMEDFLFDISADVRGIELMEEGESVEDVMHRLDLKHFRCYLLAKRKDSSTERDMPIIELPKKRKKSKPSTISRLGSESSDDADSENMKQSPDAHENKSNDNLLDGQCDGVMNQEELNKDGVRSKSDSLTNEPPKKRTKSKPNTSIRHEPESSDDADSENRKQSPDAHENKSNDNLLDGPCDGVMNQEKLNNDGVTTEEPLSIVNQVELNNGSFWNQGVQNLNYNSIATQSELDNNGVMDLQGLNYGVVPYMTDVFGIIASDSDDSGIIQFGRLTPQLSGEEVKPVVSEITVHRGRVCHDLIDFFSKEENQSNCLTTYEIKMLKEDGSPEAAEDSGGVTRDALTEFWETFYLQYTEGNTYKVPVLRHDMTEVKWKAVATVIKIGFSQEGVYPIKMAPSFMQQAIFGVCIQKDLLDSFLKFLPVMDKHTIETAMKCFESVDKDDLIDFMEQFEAKKNSENAVSVFQEIAHKELVQKPMFVADCFYKVLNSTVLVQQDFAAMYSRLEPSPRKVLNSLQFPEQMTSDETLLSSYIKRLVREMDDPQYLELFLRFCTGSDTMTKSEIHVRFTSSEVASNVRCPTAHTCGCVLEIPKSYAQDPYVVLKSDVLSLLKNRYWQMDIV